MNEKEETFAKVLSLACEINEKECTAKLVAGYLLVLEGYDLTEAAKALIARMRNTWALPLPAAIVSEMTAGQMTPPKT